MRTSSTVNYAQEKNTTLKIVHDFEKYIDPRITEKKRTQALSLIQKIPAVQRGKFLMIYADDQPVSTRWEKLQNYRFK